MIAFYEPQQHQQPFVFLRGSDAGLSGLAFDVCCLWCLGYPDQAQSRSQEVLALARELDHPYSLANVLAFAGCLFNEMRRDTGMLKDNAEELMRLSNERSFAGWLDAGTRYRGEAVAMLGQFQEGTMQMRQSMADSRSKGLRCYLAGTLDSLAEVQSKAGHPEEGLTTLDEALALVEETDERLWEAELYRLRGELLLMQGDDAEAEVSLKKAIGEAHRQNAKSWELRASTSLARLWQKQGKVDEAGQILGEIYGWFTEGFDTPDLREARALLEESAEDYEQGMAVKNAK
jgi:adenylate cyclase